MPTFPNDPSDDSWDDFFRQAREAGFPHCDCENPHCALTLPRCPTCKDNGRIVISVMRNRAALEVSCDKCKMILLQFKLARSAN